MTRVLILSLSHRIPVWQISPCTWAVTRARHLQHTQLHCASHLLPLDCRVRSVDEEPPLPFRLKRGLVPRVVRASLLSCQDFGFELVRDGSTARRPHDGEERGKVFIEEPMCASEQDYVLAHAPEDLASPLWAALAKLTHSCNFNENLWIYT